MADSTTKLNVIISANNSQFKKGLSGAEKELSGFKNSMLTQFKGIGVAAAAAFSVGAIINFGKQAAVAADVELQAQNKLLVALKGRQGVTNDLIALAAELQTKTLFGDEDTVNAMAALAVYVKDEEALKNLTKATQDFAQARGVDLATAAQVVGKSVGSSTNALKRYGLEIQGAAGSSERAASAVQALSDKFGGQAEAAARVGLGPFKILSNMIGDVVEDIGKLLMPAIQWVSNALIKAFPTGMIDSFRSKMIDLANWFIELYNGSTLFRGNIQLLGAAFNTVWQTIKTVFTGIKSLFVGTAEILKAVFTGNFKAIPGIIQEQFNKVLVSNNTNGQKIADGWINAFENTVNAKPLQLIDKNKAVKDAKVTGIAVGESFNEGVAEGKASTYNKGGAIGLNGPTSPVTLDKSLTIKKPKVSDGLELAPMSQYMTDAIKAANDQLAIEAQRTQDIMDEMNQAISGTMQDMASGFAEGIGNMIAGTGSFADIGKTILMSLGDLAVQIGKIAIAEGIAMIAIKKSFSNPATAIIAGMALVALGTAVKGAIGKTLSGSGGSSSFSKGSDGSYDSRTFSTGNVNSKQQSLKVEVVGQTTIRNKDIQIAYRNAETSKRINT